MATDGLFAGLNGSYNHAQDDVSKQDLLRRPRRSFIDILPALERRGFLLQDGNVLPHTSPSH
jgi:hypothetical protein